MPTSLEDNNQTLTLELSISSTPPPPPHHTTPPPPPPPSKQPPYEPSLTLSLSGSRPERLKKVEEPPCSATASSGVVKRERESGSSEDVEVDKSGGCCNNYYSDEDGVGPTNNGGCSTRKKLRLTKDQSALLEESFKLHSTLNPKQKQALADRLKLRPRQVEVWFQNRRARTKLKQTEVDCEYLKKCCETLTDENRRLHKEVQELKALKMGAQPLYMHLPAATLTMCPSCERIGAPGVPIAPGTPGSTNTSFVTIAAKPPFYTSFTNSSAAC